MLRGLDGNEAEVDERLELDIRRWSQGMQEELELLVVALGLDLNHIVEVRLMIRLKGHIHLDSQAGCKRPLHIMLDLEPRSLGTGELKPPDALTNIAYSHSDFVILVGLNV